MENNRRKLLLGSAAVPLVLTVRPAAATAKKSIACIADGKQNQKPYEILKTNDDGHMRKWVTVYALEVEEYDDAKKKKLWKLQTWNSQQKKKYICGTDHSYWELDKQNPYAADAKKTDMKKGYGIKEIELEKKQALAFYSSDSHHETGYGWDTNGGKHYKKSCWNSIKPKGW